MRMGVETMTAARTMGLPAPWGHANRAGLLCDLSSYVFLWSQK
jgi:hypothetical protein